MHDKNGNLLRTPTTTGIKIPRIVVAVSDLVCLLESGARNLATARAFVERHRNEAVRQMVYDAEPLDARHILERVTEAAGPEAIQAPVGIAKELAELRRELVQRKPAFDEAMEPFVEALLERLRTCSGRDFADATLVRQPMRALVVRVRIQLRRAPEALVLRGGEQRAAAV